MFEYFIGPLLRVQVLWRGAVGDADRRGPLQGRGLVCHHLGSGQQQPAAACARQLSRQLQTPAQAVLVSGPLAGR